MWCQELPDRRATVMVPAMVMKPEMARGWEKVTAPAMAMALAPEHWKP